MDIKKWNRYERRWKMRDIYFNKILRKRIMLKFFHREPVMPYYAGKWVMSTEKTNQYITEKIQSGEPFMVCRFGNTEFSIMTSALKRRLIGEDKENDERLEYWFKRAREVSGIFPTDMRLIEPFTDVMLDACKQADMFAMWHLYMEDYVLEEYAPQAVITNLYRLEPWFAKNPWSAALSGKKVLVIHPFEDSIREQYKKREQLFEKDVLPQFELKTLKAVQTIAGMEDPRFKDWFEALEYMYEEAMKIDFDIAILGCGAYGMPLAAKIKKAGKQAIHLGGATQLLFGIKGKRWEDKNYPTPISKYFNAAWIYPLDSETPKNAKVVENSCYWR